MTSTSFAGPFEDDAKGAQKGDRVRIVKGEHAGKFAAVDEELVAGYWVVTPEGESKPVLLDVDEFEPVIVPKLVAGLPVPPAVLTAPGLAGEVYDTAVRLGARVSLTGPQAADSAENLLDVLISDLDDVIVTAIETQVRVRRRLAELRGVK